MIDNYDYKSFTHIERLGTEDTEGILTGTCFISPKVDGTNACIWAMPDGSIRVGSRKRELSEEEDNAAFWVWCNSTNEEAIALRAFCKNYPRLIVYGEFGCGKVGHIKRYEPDCQQHLLIFAVLDREERRYLAYTEWLPLIQQNDAYNSIMPWIIPHFQIKNPSQEKLDEMLNNNHYMLDSDTIGEGIVIENPDFVNRYGHRVMAKIVRDEYKQDKAKKKPRPVIEPGQIEQSIIDNYVTDAELTKTRARVMTTLGIEDMHKNGKAISMFIETVYHDCVLNECAKWAKKFKQPTVDFATLKSLSAVKAREFLNL